MKVGHDGSIDNYIQVDLETYDELSKSAINIVIEMLSNDCHKLYIYISTNITLLQNFDVVTFILKKVICYVTRYKNVTVTGIS